MLVSGVVLSITAYLSFNYADQILRERTGDQLLSESQIRGETITFLFETRLEQNKILSSDPMVLLLVKELNILENSQNNQIIDEKRRDFLTQVQAFQTRIGYSAGIEDVKIIGKNGKILFSLVKTGNNDFSNDHLFLRGLQEPFVDFEPSVAEGKRMIVVTPIIDQSEMSSPIGVVISKMRTESIDNILLNRSGLGETGEVYLVNDGSLMLSESRFIDDAIFNLRVDTLPVKECFKNNKEIVGVYPDYRGVSIYGSSFCAQDLGFVLLAEIDEAETIQPILILQDRIFQTGLLISTGMAIVAYVVSKTLSRPLVKLKSAANKVADGDFNVKTEIHSHDEIGELSFAFDIMAKKLRESLIEIKQKEDVIKQQEDILLNFADHSENDCVCLIDIKDSTKVTASLSDAQSSSLYSTFLNSMASIVRSYNGIVIKNIGDALLFYFPNPEITNNSVFKNILECCLKMTESHGEINSKLQKLGLPTVDYKISATYGSVRVAKIAKSEVDDIFGSTVNRCAKINPFAPPNGFVIGESMYQIVKAQKNYSFKKLDSFVGEHEYSIYHVTRK